MLHTTLVHLSAHYSWHYFDTHVLPTTPQFTCLIFSSWKQKMGKAVIKSYCYNASLNTDLTLL